MPNVDDLRKWILDEAQISPYSIHPSFTKMYHDLREVFLLDDIIMNIVEFVAKCPNCQKVKVEYQNSGYLYD